MPYYQVSDDEPAHTKIRPLSDAAYRLNHHARSFVSKHLTDGLIRSSDLEIIAVGVKGRIKPAILELVAKGVWHEAGQECLSTACLASQSTAPAYGWILHDYWEHNPTREFALAKIERAKAAGKLGGIQKWKNAMAGRDPETSSKMPSKMLSQTLSESLSKMPSQTPSKMSSSPRGNPNPNPFRRALAPSPTSYSKPPRTGGLGLTTEADAVVRHYAETRGYPPSPADVEWLERTVSLFQKLDAEAFIQAMRQADAKLEAEGKKRFKHLEGFYGWWREANDHAAERGASPRSTDPRVVTLVNGLAGRMSIGGSRA